MTKYTWKDKMEAVPYEIVTNDTVAIKVVAVAGHDNDWAAYWGASWWDDERIAAEGAKLSREGAEPLFYCMTMSGRRYRDWLKGARDATVDVGFSGLRSRWIGGNPSCLSLRDCWAERATGRGAVP